MTDPDYARYGAKHIGGGAGRRRQRVVLIRAVLLALSAVYLVAGAGKLASPSDAATLMSRLFPISYNRGRIAVRSVALLELLTASLLVVPAGRDVGAGLSMLLGVGIVAVTIRASRYDNAIPCGCFGTGHSYRLGRAHVAIGGAIILVSLGELLLVEARPPTADIGLVTASIGALLLALAGQPSWIARPWVHLRNERVDG